MKFIGGIMTTYFDFLDKKTHTSNDFGFAPEFLPDCLFDFQKHVLDWGIRKGRSAFFEDCGLGKTLQELVWAENVCRKTEGRVLILTPLAVAAQTVNEGEKFGIECHRSHKGELFRITVTNYERLHMFNPSDFQGIVCDESSILKNFKGKYRTLISSFMRKIPYRLLASATPSPNDFIELGSSSEALGDMGYMDMLNKYFKNDLNNSAVGRHCGDVIKWRLKGHAEKPFWRWVCSWARAIRKPSDLGFEDEGFILPPLEEREHIVDARHLAEGMLFALPAVGMKEQREERRRSIEERCEKVSSLVNHTGDFAIVWCHLNDEGDLLEKMIPDAIQVSGKDNDDRKEEKLIAFAEGKTRILVTKPVIGAWGLNFQHCNHMTSFPSHSFEQYYQLIRRCYRFGQKRSVKVDIVTTEGEHRVLSNLQAKAAKAEQMFSNLVSEMNNAIQSDRSNHFTKKLEVASWL
jgi:hypothetical protein